jgi:hypothetical protein
LKEASQFNAQCVWSHLIEVCSSRETIFECLQDNSPELTIFTSVAGIDSYIDRRLEVGRAAVSLRKSAHSQLSRCCDEMAITARFARWRNWP